MPGREKKPSACKAEVSYMLDWLTDFVQNKDKKSFQQKSMWNELKTVTLNIVKYFPMTKASLKRTAQLQDFARFFLPFHLPVKQSLFGGHLLGPSHCVGSYLTSLPSERPHFK